MKDSSHVQRTIDRNDVAASARVLGSDADDAVGGDGLAARAAFSPAEWVVGASRTARMGGFADELRLRT